MTPEQGEVITLAAIIESSIVELSNKFLNLHKIYRIIAYCMRFSKKRRPTELTELISPDEMSTALKFSYKAVQRRTFYSEYEKLSKRDAQSSSNNSLSSSFMDGAGIMRIGSRLKNSNLPFDICHFILLPHSHNLTCLVIDTRAIYVRGLKPQLPPLDDFSPYPCNLASARLFKTVLYVSRQTRINLKP